MRPHRRMGRVDVVAVVPMAKRWASTFAGAWANLTCRDGNTRNGREPGTTRLIHVRRRCLAGLVGGSAVVGAFARTEVACVALVFQCSASVGNECPVGLLAHVPRVNIGRRGKAARIQQRGARCRPHGERVVGAGSCHTNVRESAVRGAGARQACGSARSARRRRARWRRHAEKCHRLRHGLGCLQHATPCHDDRRGTIAEKTAALEEMQASELADGLLESSADASR